MTSDYSFQRLEALFHELDALDPAERARRLDTLARSSPELHAELIALFSHSGSLAADEELLERMASDGGLAARVDADSLPEHIGPYRLLDLLGEGGMGRVYLAEQDEPVKRRVALKLSRRGFDSEEAATRFRIERQALAVLDHPHIARVFDAGTSEDGRPWFAMEYIEGVPITEWASQRKLGLSDRIRLLLPICDAVQQAHRKGLIHRDLKPSNILVIDDGRHGFPKVIDFGIARLMELDVDEKTRLTRLGELVGTPEYMSPEQAALGELDIDTRSDVYSLGLVLYELLVGELPISGRELRALGFEAMCRAIREGDTPRPSRMAVSDPTRDPAITAWRSQLKGDLDSVLLKALSKDRDRRYGSVVELADDLRRYLDNEPVLAQPPSVGYRAGKFIRRHRWPVATTALVLMALLAGIVLASIGMLQAREAEQRALAAAELAERERLAAEENLQRAEFFLGRANLYHMAQNAYSDALQRMFGDETDVERQTEILKARWREAHERYREEPENAALLSYAVGRHFLFRNDYPSALEVLEAWLDAGYGPADLQQLGRQLVPVLYLNLGRPDDAIPLLRANVAAYAASYEANSADHVAQATQLASITSEPRDLAQAEQLLARAMQDDHGPQIRMYFANQLSVMRRLQGDLDGAMDALREVKAVIDANRLMDISGKDTGLLNLAEFEFYHARDLESSEALVQRVLVELAPARGESRESGRAQALLGMIRLEQGEIDQAVELLDEAVARISRFSGERSRATVFALAGLLEAQAVAGHQEAARLTETRLLSALPEQDPRALSWTRAELARVFMRARSGSLESSARSDLEALLDLSAELARTEPSIAYCQDRLGTLL
jgi:non-specific serine/threonine protein kinase/serine/threonine-protein kinase